MLCVGIIHYDMIMQVKDAVLGTVIFFCIVLAATREEPREASLAVHLPPHAVRCLSAHLNAAGAVNAPWGRGQVASQVD